MKTPLITLILFLFSLMCFSQLDLDIKIQNGEAKIYFPENFPDNYTWVGEFKNQGMFKSSYAGDDEIIIETGYNYNTDKKGNSIDGTGDLYRFIIMPDTIATEKYLAELDVRIYKGFIVLRCNGKTAKVFKDEEVELYFTKEM